MCAIVLGVLHVFNIPIGTLLAIFIFIGVFSDDAKGWFVDDQAPFQAPA